MPDPLLVEIIAQLAEREQQIAARDQQLTRKDQALVLAEINIKVLEERLRLERIARWQAQRDAERLATPAAGSGAGRIAGGSGSRERTRTAPATDAARQARGQASPQTSRPAGTPQPSRTCRRDRCMQARVVCPVICTGEIVSVAQRERWISARRSSRRCGKCMVRRRIASQIRVVGGLVCSNVSGLFVESNSWP